MPIRFILMEELGDSQTRTDPPCSGELDPEIDVGSCSIQIERVGAGGELEPGQYAQWADWR
jgi:hypothetical protein